MQGKESETDVSLLSVPILSALTITIFNPVDKKRYQHNRKVLIIQREPNIYKGRFDSEKEGLKHHKNHTICLNEIQGRSNSSKFKTIPYTTALPG